MAATDRHTMLIMVYKLYKESNFAMFLLEYLNLPEHRAISYVHRENKICLFVSSAA